MARSSLWNNPVVAGLLGVMVTGLGHVYLRRWLRAFAWLAVATAISVLFVPETTAAAMLEGGDFDPVALLPAVAVTVVSAADAYVLARRAQSTDGTEVDTDTNTDSDADAASVDAANATCPYCGEEVDPELGFCHWCTREFEVDAAGDPVEET